MSDTSDSTEEPNPKPKKRNLADLLPAKVAVETSLCLLYIRHAYTKDWMQLASDDARELGRAVVRQLSSRIEDKSDSEPLAEEDFKALDDADFQKLVPVIAKQNGWRGISVGAGLEVLGDVAKTERQKLLDSHKNMLADMRKSIDSSYGFLDKGALKKLQEQMAGLVNIRSDALSSAKAPIRDLSPLMPPRPENTPLGRATLESAEHARETAQKMDALVDVVAGLNQTVVKDILPAWVKQIESGQKDAEAAFKQAARGLQWTQLAVIASVVVTVLVTWWQVSVAREIDRGNTEQQKRVQETLSKQLEAQRDLIKQQARDSASMREAIAALKSLGSGTAQKK